MSRNSVPSPNLNFFSRVVRASRLRGPAADDPTAQTLYALVLMLLFLFTFHVGIAEIRGPRRDLVTAVGSPMFLTPLATIILLRRNSVRAASIVFLAGLWVAFTAIIYLNGGIYHVGAAVYVALSVSAAWLFGYRGALLTAVVSMTATLVMAILDQRRAAPPHPLPGSPTGVWLLLAESILMAIVPVTLVLSSLRNALAKSQIAEAELKVHQQQLEEVVKQRTAELVEARDQAQTANHAKSAFLASMSHELRTPLNAILGYSALVANDPDLSQKHRSDLDAVNRSGEHLLNMIDDVLDLAKIEAGRVEVQNTSFRVQDLLRDCVESIRPRARDQGLNLDIRHSNLDRVVRADEGKLRQVIINLLGNAVKYTAEGSIEVNAEIRQTAAELMLVVEVADSGVGIALEDQPLIFDPFVQVGKRQKHEGTGLGLSITRRFLDLMGGGISLRSTPGQGSVFRIELPVVEVSDPAAMSEPARRRVLWVAPGSPEHRILIVEDRAENWMVLERILRSAGFQVQVAEDGERAINLFTSWRPALVWMDLRLPGMSGVEASCQIRQLEGGSETKIVALSASASAAERDEVLAAGLDGFLRKPFRSHEIFDCMGALLGIQYVYADESSVNESKLSLSRADLASLSSELRQGLTRAVVTLDRNRIASAIARVSECDANLGRVLTSYANGFAYSKILKALESTDDGTLS